MLFACTGTLSQLPSSHTFIFHLFPTASLISLAGNESGELPVHVASVAAIKEALHSWDVARTDALLSHLQVGRGTEGRGRRGTDRHKQDWYRMMLFSGTLSRYVNGGY